ncbi:CIS tube protein [Dictyobacter formicarum]|uniref:Peptidoglycan-binding protein n=1 Tax=Dictyobacter formicarum TaxID=2778368 RepID=A0ABQ3VC07_9CHLR|nr:LysM peptidoglycan-binding domain-containing protein [Dictyobacter formicarum]GHO83198.1 peptidoglycan-binding protein [Dictyobacter formicarum]
MALTNLAKALIINTATNNKITVMYNPEEFKLDQGNTFAEIGIPGLNAPPIQYVRGRSRTLTMDLFFDTYESQQDVRLYTGQIVNLLNTLPQTKAPPVLLFSMGRFNFECVLVDAGQRFTMFLRDGTPVRATLSVRFQEYVRIAITMQQGLFIGPPTLHNITQGQTLSGLAADYLGDPGLWRLIAQANNIDDPFHIPPGTQLIIPGGGKS